MAISAAMHTAGERLFEQYLRSRDLQFSFEKLSNGKIKPPDYTISHGGRDLLFEVKDFAEDDVPDDLSGGVLAPA